MCQMFSVDYDTIDVIDIVANISKYLMKKQYKIMLKFIKQVFIVLLGFTGALARVAKVSGSTKYLSLNNEPSLARPILIK